LKQDVAVYLTVKIKQTTMSANQDNDRWHRTDHPHQHLSLTTRPSI